MPITALDSFLFEFNTLFSIHFQNFPKIKFPNWKQRRNNEDMSQRKSLTGRPSGTDGSDFSFRMVVDSRYQKVARGKSRLCYLILAQGFIQFLAAAVLYLSTLKWGALDGLSVASSLIYIISLLIGELGRKRSRVGLLKLYLFGSSSSVLLSLAYLLKSDKTLEIIKDSSKWEATNLELYKIASVSLGLLIQILALTVTTSLVGNMAPPKRMT